MRLDFSGWTRRDYELLAQRACFAAVLFGWLGWLQGKLVYAPPTNPVGLAEWFETWRIAQPGLALPLRLTSVVLLMAYVAGRFPALASGGLALLWTIQGAAYVSQGTMGHATQAVALVLIAQAIAYGREASMEGAAPGLGRSGHERAEWYSRQTIVATYVVAGVTKLIHTSGLWAWHAPNLAVEIARRQDQWYYETLGAHHLERGELVVSTMLAYPNLMRVALLGVLLVETGSFIALFGRRASVVVGLLLLSLHLGIGVLMHIRFPQHEWLLLLYLVGAPAWLVRVGVTLWPAWLSPARPRPQRP